MEDNQSHAVSKPNRPNVSTVDVVRHNLNQTYLTPITNFFDGDRPAALRFMTGFVDSIRRNPRILQCTPSSIVNAAMMIASFRFNPSPVAGEAYIIPYKNKGTEEAQFQPGYQGYVTLFYRAGVRAIQAEIVREHDDLSLENGMVVHRVDPRKSREERGSAIGVYVRVVLPSGEPIYKYMNASDVLAHARRFSKSFSKDDSPWKEANDPELNMWKKTALLQLKGVLPKNSEITRAMEEDYKDSTIEQPPALDAEGPATKKVSHAPTTTPPEVPLCRAGKHRVAPDPDGDCPDCVAEALSAEEKVIEA